MVISILVLSASTYSFIHHQRHTHFLTAGWDLAVFDQPIYLFSRGKLPFSSLHNMNTLGDHFHPLLLLVGGLIYSVWSDPRALLWLESLIAVASGGALYLFTKLLCKKHLQKLPKVLTILLPFSVMLMYLLSVGFQSMLLDDFHDDVLITLPLMLSVLFILKRD